MKKTRLVSNVVVNDIKAEQVGAYALFNHRNIIAYKMYYTVRLRGGAEYSGYGRNGSMTFPDGGVEITIEDDQYITTIKGRFYDRNI